MNNNGRVDMDNETRKELIAKSPITFESLRKWNIRRNLAFNSRDNFNWPRIMAGMDTGHIHFLHKIHCCFPKAPNI